MRLKFRQKAKCHPKRDQQGKGLCNKCYCKQYKIENREKLLQLRKEYLERNPDLQRVWNIRQLNKSVGITQEIYDTTYKKQNGACAICKRLEKDCGPKGFHRDHNHNTNKFRGLLCVKCNVGISYFEDNPQLLEEAIKYLANNYENKI